MTVRKSQPSHRERLLVQQGDPEGSRCDDHQDRGQDQDAEGVAGQSVHKLLLLVPPLE